MNDNDLAYLAGFMDGEGSIGLYRQSPKKKRDGSPRENPGNGYTLQLMAVNYSLLPIQRLQDAFGGAISSQRMVTDNTAYYYNLKNRDKTKVALESMLPFLTVKHRQAELALEFLKLRLVSNQSPDKVVLDAYEELSKKLKYEKTNFTASGPQDSSRTIPYMSGFFDGEGTLGLYVDNFCISIAGYCEAPLKLYELTFGANISTRYLGDRDRTLYTASIRGVDKIDSALKVLRPFLSVKAKQADTVMEFTSRVILGESAKTILHEYVDRLKREKREY